MEIMILSFIGAAVGSEWHLSPGEKSMISTVVFAGMLVGSFFWGVTSDNYGRTKGILGLATVAFVAGLLSAFSPNYMSLLVLRCIVGFGLGGMHIVTSWFLKFIPVPNRGIRMIVFSSFWTIGTIFEAGLAWVTASCLGGLITAVIQCDNLVFAEHLSISFLPFLLRTMMVLLKSFL